jgi:hypothetical protein
MDTFELCREAFERASWSYRQSVDDLEFDLSRRLLPNRLCGDKLPDWLGPDERHVLNHIRGFSYAHIFLFVEEFIIQQTCSAALTYVQQDSDALAAMLRFSEEETKHQRMFARIKDLLSEALGFRPRELAGKEEVAQAINSRSSLAVFMVTLALEWLTQRHYVECFQPHEKELDAGFVRVFRLHWTEEAQHARMDTLQLRMLASTMETEELETSAAEFLELTDAIQRLLLEQDALDLASFEQALGRPFDPDQHSQLLAALNQEWLWTFLVSGLEHSAFQAVFHDVIPDQILNIDQVIARMDSFDWTST